MDVRGGAYSRDDCISEDVVPDAAVEFFGE